MTSSFFSYRFIRSFLFREQKGVQLRTVCEQVDAAVLPRGRPISTTNEHPFMMNFAHAMIYIGDTIRQHHRRLAGCAEIVGAEKSSAPRL